MKVKELYFKGEGIRGSHAGSIMRKQGRYYFSNYVEWLNQLSGEDIDMISGEWEGIAEIEKEVQKLNSRVEADTDGRMQLVMIDAEEI